MAEVVESPRPKTEPLTPEEEREYLKKWEDLTPNSQRALIYMRTVATSVSEEELRTVVPIEKEHGSFEQSIQELVDAKFLHPGEKPEVLRERGDEDRAEEFLSGEKKRYHITPKTRTFITETLPRIWEKQGLLTLKQ